MAKKGESHQEDVNAVAMLKKDHDKVNALFTQFQRAAESDRQALATQLFNELDVHATLEEEIFYPAVRQDVDLESVVEDEEVDEEEEELDEADEGDEEELEDESEDLIAVSLEEHKDVRELVQQLRGMDLNTPEYKERFAELKEAVQDHISEEEEVIFPAAQLKLDLETLGHQMQQRRIALVSSMAA